MKNFKIFNALSALCISSILTGCGNKDMFDTEKGFNFALESNNEIVSIIGVEKYYDYSGDQVQLITRDGLTILTSVRNTELIKIFDRESLENYAALKTDDSTVYYVDEMNGNELDFTYDGWKKGLFDTNYTYDKIIMQEDDHILIANVKQWTDFEDDKIQVTLNNDMTLLLSSEDIKLVATNGNDDAFYNYCLSLVGDENKIFYYDTPGKVYTK